MNQDANRKGPMDWLKRGYAGCMAGGVILFGIIEACVYLPVFSTLALILTWPDALNAKIAIPAVVTLGGMALCIAVKAEDRIGELRKLGLDGLNTKRIKNQERIFRIGVTMGVVFLVIALMNVVMVASGSYPYQKARTVNSALGARPTAWNTTDGGGGYSYIQVNGDWWRMSEDGKSATMTDHILCPVKQTHKFSLEPGAEILDMNGKPETCKSVGLHRVILKITTGLFKQRQEGRSATSGVPVAKTSAADSHKPSNSGDSK